MLYAIFGEDISGSLRLRREARPAHQARLKALQAEGRLVIAGPFPSIDAPDPGPAGFSGSLIIAEFDSLAAAKAWAETDPYSVAGAYANTVVKPFRQIFPQ